MLHDPEDLAEVPARPRLALDVARAEVMDALGEVAAEDDHEGPHVADHVGGRVGGEHPEEEGPRERRPQHVVLQHLAPHLPADAREHRPCLRPASSFPARTRLISRSCIAMTHSKKSAISEARERLEQVERMPALLLGHAQHAVADVAVLAEHVGPGVMDRRCASASTGRRGTRCPTPRCSTGSSGSLIQSHWACRTLWPISMFSRILARPSISVPSAISAPNASQPASAVTPAGWNARLARSRGGRRGPARAGAGSGAGCSGGRARRGSP